MEQPQCGRQGIIWAGRRPPCVAVDTPTSWKTRVSFPVGTKSTYVIAFLQGLREIREVKSLKEIYLAIARVQQRRHGRSRASGGGVDPGYSVGLQRGRGGGHPSQEPRGPWCGRGTGLGQWKGHISRGASFYGPQPTTLRLPISFGSPSPSQSENLESRPDDSACVSRFSVFSWAAGRASF